MKAYTLKEVSKKITVSPSTLKQWEKDLQGVLVIPRTKQGARFYTELEVEQLSELKQLYHAYNSKETVRQIWIDKQVEATTEIVPEPSEISLEVVSSEVPFTGQLNDPDAFFAAMDTYKESFLNEVKDEIRSVVQKEVVGEMKKEISKGMLHSVKSLSDSIYKSSANTQAGLAELAGAVGKVSDQTTETYHSISSTIATHTLGTSEEIFTLSKQLSETSEELSHYIDVTNKGIDSLTDVLAQERENYVENLEQFRHEIRQREVAFQSMLSGFRETAPSRDKKWWQFWQ